MPTAADLGKGAARCGGVEEAADQPEGMGDQAAAGPGEASASMGQWWDEYYDALNEDLSRILLGEPAPR